MHPLENLEAEDAHSARPSMTFLHNNNKIIMSIVRNHDGNSVGIVNK